jgi:hypothetical protein
VNDRYLARRAVIQNWTHRICIGNYTLFTDVALDMPSHGLKSGDVGAVVQVYSADAIEVEIPNQPALDSQLAVG